MDKKLINENNLTEELINILYKDLNLDLMSRYVLMKKGIKMNIPLPTYDNAIFPIPSENKELYEDMKVDIFYEGKPSRKTRRLLKEYLKDHKDTINGKYKINSNALNNRLIDYIDEKWSRITSPLNDKGEPIIIENGEEYLSTYSWDYGDWGYDKVDNLINPGKYSIKVGNWQHLGNNIDYRLMDIAHIYNLYKKDNPDYPTQYIRLNKPVLDEFKKEKCTWFVHDLLCFSGIPDSRIINIINYNKNHSEEESKIIGNDKLIKDMIKFYENL